MIDNGTAKKKKKKLDQRGLGYKEVGGDPEICTWRMLVLEKCPLVNCRQSNDSRACCNRYFLHKYYYCPSYYDLNSFYKGYLRCYLVFVCMRLGTGLVESCRFEKMRMK